MRPDPATALLTVAAATVAGVLLWALLSRHTHRGRPLRLHCKTCQRPREHRRRPDRTATCRCGTERPLSTRRYRTPGDHPDA